MSGHPTGTFVSSGASMCTLRMTRVWRQHQRQNHLYIIFACNLHYSYKHFMILIMSLEGPARPSRELQNTPALPVRCGRTCLRPSTGPEHPKINKKPLCSRSVWVHVIMGLRVEKIDCSRATNLNFSLFFFMATTSQGSF